MVVGQKHQPEVWDVAKTTKKPKKQKFEKFTDTIPANTPVYCFVFQCVYEVGKSIGFAIAIRTSPCSNAGRCCCGRVPLFIQNLYHQVIAKHKRYTREHKLHISTLCFPLCVSVLTTSTTINVVKYSMILSARVQLVCS